MAKELMKMGASYIKAWKTAPVRKGWWGKSMLNCMHIGIQQQMVRREWPQEPGKNVELKKC